MAITKQTARRSLPTTIGQPSALQQQFVESMNALGQEMDEEKKRKNREKKNARARAERAANANVTTRRKKKGTPTKVPRNIIVPPRNYERRPMAQTQSPSGRVDMTDVATLRDRPIVGIEAITGKSKRGSVTPVRTRPIDPFGEMQQAFINTKKVEQQRRRADL